MQDHRREAVRDGKGRRVGTSPKHTVARRCERRLWRVAQTTSPNTPIPSRESARAACFQMVMIFVKRQSEEPSRIQDCADHSPIHSIFVVLRAVKSLLTCGEYSATLCVALLDIFARQLNLAKDARVVLSVVLQAAPLGCEWEQRHTGPLRTLNTRTGDGVAYTRHRIRDRPLVVSQGWPRTPAIGCMASEDNMPPSRSNLGLLDVLAIVWQDMGQDLDPKWVLPFRDISGDFVNRGSE